MKRMLIAGTFVCLVTGGLFAAQAAATVPPLTDCHTAFNWELQCCAESAAEVARWTYCRCMQSDDGDCLAKACAAHNDALNTCEDVGEDCPPVFYWFP